MGEDMTTTVWKEFQTGLDYQNKMGFSRKWPEYTRFIEGDQWPKPTEKTKYMPRPVINQCDFIVENKQSNILSQSLKMVYSAEERPEGMDMAELDQGAEDYTDMASNTWDDIDQDALNEDYVNDALSLGTGILHYYFDNSIKGGQFTKFVGKMQGETIDPMDIILGNPQLKPHQIQKQPFIIIRTYEDVEKVKEAAKKNGENWQNIKADDKGTDKNYDSAQKDMEGANKVTCLTKYYKKNGQVYWTKVTESAIVQKTRTLKPDDIELEDGTVIETKPFTLYPVDILVFKKRRKCTFGRSVIEDIIPNQKALNWGIGMMLLSVQQTAWPKIIAKAGALTQSITNEPGEIITDRLPVQGVDGIKFMQPPNFSQMPMALTEKLLDMTRQVTGTTEVTAGEILGANMAAAAIIALQNQAKKPNESFQNKLFRSMKNIGRIWEEFYKCYYNMPRPIQGKDKEGNKVTKNFVGSKCADMQFGLKVDVGPASVFSESLQVTIVDKLFDKGDIDKYKYVKYLPKNVVSQELAHDFEKEAEQLQEQQETQKTADNILNQLTPEELQHLKENPHLLQQLMGGTQDGMPEM